MEGRIKKASNRCNKIPTLLFNFLILWFALEKRARACFLSEEVPWTQNTEVIISFFLSNCKEMTIAKQLMLLFEAPLNVSVRE